VKKIKFILVRILVVLSLTAGIQFSVLAHDPPYEGKMDCGIIQANLFYSDYYSPPTGTPASNGACSWVKQGTSSCGTRNYGGTNYTLYTYKWICNVPLDTNIYMLMMVVIGFGYFKLYRSNFSFISA
jgi:hypothetical protein